MPKIKTPGFAEDLQATTTFNQEVRTRLLMYAFHATGQNPRSPVVLHGLREAVGVNQDALERAAAVLEAHNLAQFTLPDGEAIPYDLTPVSLGDARVEMRLSHIGHATAEHLALNPTEKIDIFAPLTKALSEEWTEDE